MHGPCTFKICLLKRARGFGATLSLEKKAAERAFSHLKRIVDALGKGCLWDELEARMMRRANPQDIREVDGTLPTH